MKILSKNEMNRIDGGRRHRFGSFLRLRHFLAEHPHAIERWRAAHAEEDEIRRDRPDHRRFRHFLAEHPHAIERWRMAQ